MVGVRGKRKKRKPTTKQDNKAQSERFIEAAKALGVDETGQAFERALDSVVPRKPVKRKRDTK